MFGNPFTHLPLGKTKAEFQVKTREEAIEKYRELFLEMLEDPYFKFELEALKDRTLGCFCKPLDCHGDIIAGWLDKDD